MSSTSTRTGGTRKPPSRRGEGSIRLMKRGLWQGRITLNGKRTSVYGKTKAEVQAKLAAARTDNARGLPQATRQQTTVATWLKSWLEAQKLPVRGSAWMRKEQYCRLHIVPALGSTPLTKLTASQVQTFYARLIQRGLSPKTVRNLHYELHSALDDAMRQGLVATNVCDLIDPPRRVRRQQTQFNESQIIAFREAVLAAHAADDKATGLPALWLLAISTAVRPGEYLALTWQQVDLERQVAHVVAGRQRTTEGKWFTGEPKTASGWRTVPLDSQMVGVLREHRTRQIALRSRRGAAFVDHDLVFCTRNGTHYAENNAGKYFHRFREGIGLPRIRPYDLRGSCSTWLAEQGVHPKAVAALLGHADIGTTLSYYTGLTAGMQQSAADALERLATRNS